MADALISAVKRMKYLKLEPEEIMENSGKIFSVASYSRENSKQFFKFIKNNQI